MFLKELPFAGRRAEMQTIAEFCKQTVEGERLFVLWLEGEAGIGKSRLLAEFTDEFLQESQTGETIILHIRLYPDSATSPGWLIAGALRTHNSARNLLTETVRPDLASAVHAIRRLTRLRPTVLVLDDVHWLTRQGGEELAQLLHALREQPLAVICSSRPGQGPGYNAAAGFIARILSLSPLNSKDLLQLLKAVDIPFPDVSTVELLQAASHGIPLLLPGLIGKFVPTDKEETHGTVETLRTQITDILQLSKESLIAGLLSTMDAKERQAAKELSVLGEVFSEESAIIILGEDRKGLLQALHAKRILVHPLQSISPLRGRPQHLNKIWGFAHSLLHESLFKGSTIVTDRLVTLLEAEITLYSITSIRKILEQMQLSPFGEQELSCLKLVVTIAQLLLYQTHVQAASQLLDPIRNIYSNLEENQRAELTLQITRLRISIAAIHPGSPEHQEAMNEALDLTAHPQTELQAIERLQVFILIYRGFSNRSRIVQEIEDRLAEIDALITQFPSLITCNELIAFLGMMAAQVRRQPRLKHIEQLIDYYHRIHGEITPTKKQERLEILLHMFAAMLLPLFTTPEDLCSRQQMAENVMEFFQRHIPEQVQNSYVRFLIISGQVIQARSYLEHLPLGFGELLATRDHIRIQQIFISAVLGAPLSLLEKQLREIAARTENELNTNAREGMLSFREIGAATFALTIGRMTGNDEWSRTLAEELVGNDLIVVEYMTFNQLADYRIGTFQYDDLEPLVPQALAPLLKAATAPEFNPTSFQQSAKTLLETPVIQLDELFILVVTIAVLEGHSNPNTQERYSDIFHSEIHNKLSSTIQWCLKNNLVGYIPRLLTKASNYLTQREANDFTRQYNKLKQDLAKKSGWDSLQVQQNRKIVLTMIGAITIEQEGPSKQRIQGSKARRTLGLMVASELMRYRLSLEDFRTIATGINPEHGDPANALRQVVSRLRSVLGKDAILSDGQSPPRLNLQAVSVDVIQAWQTLDNVVRYVRNNQPSNARSTLISVLKMIGSEPVYPALYGEFFESARSDFEVHLRNSVLAVAHALNHEEDYEGATTLLNLAYEQLPNDEEIVEELLSLLRRLERSTEEFQIRQHQIREAKDKRKGPIS